MTDHRITKHVATALGFGITDPPPRHGDLSSAGR